MEHFFVIKYISFPELDASYSEIKQPHPMLSISTFYSIPQLITQHRD